MDLLAKEIVKDVNLDEVTAKMSGPKSPMDHWSPAVLLERAAYLRKLAKHGDGSASETLKEYPQHCAMLSFRGRDGEAEVHDKFADQFCVLAGKATLVTGGVVNGARMIAPGETRGVSIDGGARQTLRSEILPTGGGNAASDDCESRGHDHMPGDEGAGSCVGASGRGEGGGHADGH